MVRSTYGPMAHRLTSVLTYIGLALGFIGGALSLPFGLYVLLAQREPERYLLDQVCPSSSWLSGFNGRNLPCFSVNTTPPSYLLPCPK